MRTELHTFLGYAHLWAEILLAENYYKRAFLYVLKSIIS